MNSDGDRDRRISTKRLTQSVAGVWVYVIFIPLIGMLAAIAIPQYQDYVTRAKVASGIAFVAPVTAGVERTYVRDHRLPHEGAQMHLVNLFVESVEVAGGSGQIAIHYNPATMGAGITEQSNTLTLTPEFKQNQVIWVCGDAVSPDGAVTGTGTTIRPMYLPASCR